MTTSVILNHLRARGCRLAVRDGQLLVSRQRLLPADLLAAVRTNKAGLILHLEAEAAQLRSDCAPWLHLARQIMAGEFNGGDSGLLDSLLIGVRNIKHPACQQARIRLEAMLGRTRREARP